MDKKKLTIVAGTALVATASGIATTTAQADTMPNDTTKNDVVTQAQTPEQKAKTAVADAQKEVDSTVETVNTSKNKLIEAKNNATKVENAVNGQKVTVNAAQQNVDQKQEAVNKAQEIVDQATPEKVSQVENNITAQQKEITTTQENINNTQSDIGKAQQDVVNAQSEANTAQQSVNAQNESVTTAQKELDQANDVLNNSNSGQAQKNLDEAKEKVTNTQTAVNDKQAQVNENTQALKNAQEQATIAQQNLDQATTAFQNAQQKKTETTNKVSAAQEAVNQAQTVVNNTQTQLNDVNDKLSNINSITLPNGYVEALKKFDSDGTNENSNAVLAFRDQGYNSNKFKANKADEQVMVEFGPDHPMNPEIQKQLTQFVAELLNPIRKQFGTNQLTINEGSLEFAQAIANGYDKDSWNVFNWLNHDCKLINSLAKARGLASTVINGQFYEQLGSTDWDGSSEALKPQKRTINLSKLKQELYETILSMLFSDGGSKWGHAIGLSGLSNMGSSNEAIGISIDSMDQRHIILIGDNYIVDSKGKYAQNAKKLISVPNTLQNLTTQKGQLEKLVATQNSDLNIKKQALSELLVTDNAAQNDLDKKQSALTDSQNILSNKQQNVVEAQRNLTANKSLLAALEFQLLADKAEQEKAQKEVDNYAADLAKKQAAVDQAKEKLSSEHSKLANLSGILENKLFVLASAQKALEGKQEQLKDLQKSLNKVQNELKDTLNLKTALLEAPANLEKTQSELKVAKDDLVKQQTILSTLEEKYADAKQEVSEAQKAYDLAEKSYAEAEGKLSKAKSNYDDLQKYLLSLKKVEKHAKNELVAKKNGYHIEKDIDNSGTQISDWKVKNGVAYTPDGTAVNLPVSKTSDNKVEQKVTNISVEKNSGNELSSVLPQTGDSSSKMSLFGSIIIGLTSLLGLVEIDRRKKKEF